MQKPVAVVKAEHNSGAAARNAVPDDFYGLRPEIKLAVGARVMYKTSTWTEDGLVNGQIGTVKAIVYANDTAPPNHLPKAVIVEFPNYIGPGYKGVPHHVALTPNTVEATINGKKCSRTQLAIVLAFGMTIHKSQGLTVGPGCPLGKLVINIGNKEHQSGLTFVALSRAKNISCLAMYPFPNFDRLEGLATACEENAR
mmetsp:Transcript_41887/g.107187  ORF Transcript_41887/g.107187 Transcript_41887/m.107187 type:complete len:198 (+) Transcript_41887:1975-2568(+)